MKTGEFKSRSLEVDETKALVAKGITRGRKKIKAHV